MINPELYFEIWKQEHSERVRAAALRRAATDARRSRAARAEPVDRSRAERLRERASET